MLENTEEYKRGNAAEIHVEALLQKQGWHTVPIHQLPAGHYAGPQIRGNVCGHVLPDLFIANHAQSLWVEVKLKESATYTRRTQRLEHGIPHRHFMDYVAIEQISGIPVMLFVIEEDTDMILWQLLNVLEGSKREYGGGKMSRGGMVFFPRSVFIDYAKEKIPQAPYPKPD